MQPDATYKHLLFRAFMVEELLRRLVADLRGMRELVSERGEAGVTWRADPLFAGDGYVLLDTHRVGPDDLRRDNAAALLAGLENPSRETIAALVASLHERLRAPELRELKEVMLSWAAWQARRQVGVEWEAEEMAQVRVEDYDDVEAYYAARLEAWREEDREQGRAEGREQGRTEGREQGRAEGREQGRAEGQRVLLRRQAALKFDAETAASLAELLDGVTDQEVFDAVLAAIAECDTPAGVLARTAEACRHENGDNAPADG